MSCGGDISDATLRDDEVFRARSSLSRTPPLNGRKRSLMNESTSEDDDMEPIRDRKKQKLRPRMEGNTKFVDVSEIIESIHVACTTIEESISKEVNHKIQFNKKERDVVRTGVSDILKDCSMLLAVAVDALTKCNTIQSEYIEKEMQVARAAKEFQKMAKEYERQISALHEELKQAKTQQTMTNNALTPAINKPVPAKRTRMPR